MPDVEAIREFFLTKSLTLDQSACLDENGDKKAETSDDDKMAVVKVSANARSSNSTDSSYGTDTASTNDFPKQVGMSQDVSRTPLTGWL